MNLFYFTYFFKIYLSIFTEKASTDENDNDENNDDDLRIIEYHDWLDEEFSNDPNDDDQDD